jgi:malate dehydrogenase
MNQGKALEVASP